MSDGDFRPVGFGWGDLYEVSSKGTIRHIGSCRHIGTVSGNGYVRVSFSGKGRKETHLAHKLVAAAFIGPRPDNCHIDHINGDRADNRVINLRYCSPAENIRFTVERGAQALGERNGAAALTAEQAAILRQRKAEGGRYWGRDELAAEFGVAKSTIQRAAAGKTHAIRALGATGANTEPSKTRQDEGQDRSRSDER